MDNKNDEIKVVKRPLTYQQKSVGKMSLMVKNLHPDAKPGLLVELMKDFGPVFRPRIIPNKNGSDTTVYGFVDLQVEQANQALRFFQSHEVIYKDRSLDIVPSIKQRSELSSMIDDFKVITRIRKFKRGNRGDIR